MLLKIKGFQQVSQKNTENFYFYIIQRKESSVDEPRLPKILYIDVVKIRIQTLYKINIDTYSPSN